MLRFVHELDQAQVRGSTCSKSSAFNDRIRAECGREWRMACTEQLLATADETYRRRNFHVTSNLFGVSKVRLSEVPTDEWLSLMMRVFMMDYMNMVTGNRYPTEWGLEAVLRELRKHRLSGPPHCTAFHDSFYVASHIVYVFSAYSKFCTAKCAVPWLTRYLHASCHYWLQVAASEDDDHYLDGDAIAGMASQHNEHLFCISFCNHSQKW